MPTALIKSYAKKAKKSIHDVEKIWDEATKAASKKFKDESPHFWAYVNGTVKSKLKLTESTTFKEFVELSFDAPTVAPQSVQGSSQEPSTSAETANYGRFISTLFSARDKTHELHLATQSYAQHIALNELYDLLLDHADKMAESFQGKYGIIPINTPGSSVFEQTCAVEFINYLIDWFEGTARSMIGTDSYIINQFEELVGDVYQIKYKLDNLS